MNENFSNALYRARSAGSSYFKAVNGVKGMIEQYMIKPDSKIVIAAPTKDFSNLELYTKLAKQAGFDFQFTKPEQQKENLWFVNVIIKTIDNNA